MSGLRQLRVLLAGRTGTWSALTGLWVLLRLGMLMLGLLLQDAFDGLTGGGQAALGVWSVIAILTAIELARLVIQFGVVITRLEPNVQYHTMASLRLQMFRSALRRPGLRLGVPPGEALTAVGQDVDEAGVFVGWLPTIVARWLFAVAALAIMASINLTVTAGVVALFAAVLVAMRLAHRRLLAYREATRSASAAVSGALRETITAVSAIQAVGAEETVTNHIDGLNEVRRRAAVREELYAAVQRHAVANAAPLGTGLILILVAPSMAAGFTIGDLALFTYYVQLLTDTLGSLGVFAARVQRVQVALRRIRALLGTGGSLRADRRIDLDHDRFERDDPRGGLPPASPPRVRVHGLTAHYPGTSEGITDVSFELPPGSLTVVTGPVGAGKTTLLRALLGLMPRAGGTVHYDDIQVDARAAVFVPPRCAYTPQVPHLFSGSIRDNVLLGLADDGLARATERAVLGPDLAQMPDGLDTVVGPRGLRLSGGQVQRVAVARMLVRGTPMLVCDDLSSALDARTDEQLWDRLLSGDPVTVLAVSHRPALLRRADQILLLRRGLLVGAGPLDDLLATSAVMRSLWSRYATRPERGP